MTIWERPAERIRREQEITRRRELLDGYIRWCKEHPIQAHFIYLGFLVTVAELAMLLRCAIERITN